ncbi:DoxX family protein [Mucilaginibacter xinganensis]|uniref:DoxX-like family protein n=1 Tax=Mucilaginibacter xinganensis TaxID=1234841 RepID=A0A223NWS8_9SPHI|nr:DoxX family protein [Mucilaginibacter xinganensis]ASU34333.1 hypothetical protein MuYL_2446 [Mucilaginibacter xinganensis]
MLLKILTIISAASFIYYGISFFTNSGMEEEFRRYNLDKFRKFIGVLQLLGGSGLLAGLFWQPGLIISSGGLALLMLVGFGVRVKMKDGLLASMPSFIFMLLNSYICFAAICR